MRRRVPCISVITVVLMLSGCVDAPAPSSETTVSRADYIASADTICGEARARENKLPRFFEGILELNLSVVAGYYDAVVPIFKTREGELRRLRPPEGNEARIEALLEEGQRQLALAREVARLANSGNLAQTRVARRQLELASQRLLGLRADYGFEECARGAFSKEKAEYLARGDDICAELFHRLATIPPPPLDGRGAARYAAQVVPLLRESMRDLGDLDVPTGDEGRVRPMFTELQTALPALEKASAASDEATARKELNEASTALVGGLLEANGSLVYRGAILAARGYGFRDCGGLLREPLDVK